MSRKQKWRSNHDDNQLDDLPISLTIETLTGTTFEISVSPDDYISSLKSRIQRVEGLSPTCSFTRHVFISVVFSVLILFNNYIGIPVNQQHLLLGETILANNTTIANNNLRNGATLRLVLSLQGGPIGTSRRMLPLDNETIRQLVNLNKSVILCRN